jgi:hypothetical protein
VRAASVPRRITRVTRTSPAPPVAFLQGVDDHVLGVLRTWTQVEYRSTLREWVDCQPQPQHLFVAA